MISFFTHPWSFLATLFAVPALIAIYWLRSRSRRVAVSSLLLWLEQREIRQGGRYFQRLHTPLVFFLELLALLCIIIAAAGPMVPSWRGMSPLVVVLDDSFSMRAKNSDGKTARDLAAAALKENMSNAGFLPLRLVIAGQTPQFLGDPARTLAELSSLLSNWQCQSTGADIKKALALATEFSGGKARILVMSDQPPPENFPQQGKVRWWAFGAPEPNVAFVNAVRITDVEQDRCLLEIVNFSDQATRTTLRVATGKTGETQALSLKPGQRYRKIFKLPPASGPMTALLGDDSLALDNKIVLLPQPEKKIRVKLEISHPKLQALLEKTLRDTKSVKLTSSLPHLLITDKMDAVASPETWTLKIRTPKKAICYIGPFIVDRAHPLSTGLSLGGVVWAGDNQGMKGAPVISAGNTPLLTDRASGVGAHEIFMTLQPSFSNFQNNVDWPILIWNLVHWRAEHTYGITHCNIRLGSDVLLSLPPEVKTVSIVGPNGKKRELPIHGVTTIQPDEAGKHLICYGKNEIPLVVNVLSPRESRLLDCTFGQWGDWITDEALRRDYRDVAWIFLLLALLSLLLIAMLIFYKKGRRE